MKRLDDAIEDEKISQDIRRLEAVSRKIFDQVKADPSKLPQIRRGEHRHEGEMTGPVQVPQRRPGDPDGGRAVVGKDGPARFFPRR